MMWERFLESTGLRRGGSLWNYFFEKMSKKVSDFVTFLSISQLSDVRSSKFDSLQKGEIKAFQTVCVIFRKNEYYRRYKPLRARLRRARDGFFSIRTTQILALKSYVVEPNKRWVYIVGLDDATEWCFWIVILDG